MNNLRTLIVEYDFNDALYIERLLKNIGHQVISIVDNAGEALETIFVEQPDLIIMDVLVKGRLDGLQIAKRIHNEGIPIILISAYDDNNIASNIENNSQIVFLEKPLNTENLKNAIKILINQSSDPFSFMGNKRELNSIKVVENSIFIKYNNNLRRVNFTDIQSIQSEGNYCMIHTEQRKYAIKISLKRIQEVLPADMFIQIHQRHVVPLHKITNIELSNSKVFIGSDDMYPIGRKYKDSLMEKIRFLK